MTSFLCTETEIDHETQCCTSCTLHKTQSLRACCHPVSEQHQEKYHPITDSEIIDWLRLCMLYMFKPNNQHFFTISYNMYHDKNNEEEGHKNLWLCYYESVYEMMHLPGKAMVLSEKVFLHNEFVSSVSSMDNVLEKLARLNHSSQTLVWIMVCIDPKKNVWMSYSEILDMRVTLNTSNT